MPTLTDALLDPLLGAATPSGAPISAKGPRITYFDDATGERIELSTVTLANWAAKTANLLRDEFGAGPGSRVAVLLPAHWQTAAVLLGVWWIGAEVVLTGAAGPATSGTGAAGPATSGTGAARPATSGTGAARPATSGTGAADIALCTRDRLAEADDAVAGAGEVAVLSLDPFGKPAADLPIGVTDYATAVRVHGDQVVPERVPGPALDGRSVDEVLTEARRGAQSLGLIAGDRVMSDRSWSTPQELVDHLLAVLAAGASLVQLANPDPAALERRRVTEKVTRTLD